MLGGERFRLEWQAPRQQRLWDRGCKAARTLVAKPGERVDGEPQRGRPVRPVRVGGNGDTSGRPQNAKSFDPGAFPVQACHRPGVDLHCTAHLELALEHMPACSDPRQRALGMSHQYPESALAKLVGRRGESVIEATEGRLKEYPTVTCWPLRYAFQLTLREAAHNVMSQLAAAQHTDGNALPAHAFGDLTHTIGERTQVGCTRRINVGRGDDGPRPLARRSTSQPNGFLERLRAIIDSGEQVKMELDESRHDDARPRPG